MTVAPRSQECFFEDLQVKEKLLGTFEVTAGGQQDINIRVTGPDSKIIYESEREKEGYFQFAALTPGPYQVCFSNSISTMTSKTLSFNIYAGHDLNRYQSASASHLEPVDKAVMNLTENVRRTSDIFHYFRSRTLACLSTSSSMMRRVYWWGVFNCIIAIVGYLLRTVLIVRPFAAGGAPQKQAYNYMYQPI